MSNNTLPYIFSKKQLWYVATVCGFAMGLAIGWWFIISHKPSTYWQAGWLELFFWVFPAGGAGAGMGFTQWVLIRRIHKNTGFWVPATAIGTVVITGVALLILLVISYYRSGNLSSYSNLPGWLMLLTLIAPIIIFTGPFLQWLILRHITNNHAFKELLRLSIGWIVSTIIFFILLGLTMIVLQVRNDMIYAVGIGVSAVPSGLIFAYSTLNIVRNPQTASRHL